MKPIVPLLGAVLILTACHDGSPTSPAEKLQPAVTETSPARQVIGGGTFVRDDLEGSPRGSYAFRAQVDGEGTVTGQAEIHFATLDVQVHIDIQCLAVQGNDAWLSGPVTSSSDPTMPVGRVLVWQVQDNGDGEAVFPDRISAFAWSGSGNYAPDVCRWKYPMSMRPWENGNVRILAPGSVGLWDLVGTWDVTKFICINLANPADTQFLAGSGVAMRQTIAPDGRWTMVYWLPGPPGVIFENTRGWTDVQDGVVRVFGDESPTVIEYPADVTGNVLRMEFDGNVCHWDDDDQEDPSHVVGESRRKRTGVLVDDVAGTWDATVWRYTSVADPTVTVDQVAQGIAITLTLGLDSHYELVFRLGDLALEESGEMIFEGNELLTRKSEGGLDAASSGTFELRGDVFSFTGLADNDMDGNPGTPNEPATLLAVLVRR